MQLTLGLAEFVLPINAALMNMNPSITVNGTQTNIPYKTEDIVSNCVKLAGSSYMQQELDQYIVEISHHLSPFANGSTAELVTAISHLIYMLQLKFKEYGWYDSDGSCPWRFVGFEGYMNIQLGKPDNGPTVNHLNNFP